MTIRRYDLYLKDILLSMHRIEEYLKGLTFDQFEQNYLIIDAVVRNFEIIGEAANKIPKPVKEKYPKVPWDAMYSLRNIVIHEYFGVDIRMLWEIATNHLPENHADLIYILKKEGII